MAFKQSFSFDCHQRRLFKLILLIPLKKNLTHDNNLLVIFCYFRFDQESQTVIPVRVNISISIKDILQIKEIDHTYTLKVIINIFSFQLKNSDTTKDCIILFRIYLDLVENTTSHVFFCFFTCVFSYFYTCRALLT